MTSHDHRFRNRRARGVRGPSTRLLRFVRGRAASPAPAWFATGQTTPWQTPLRAAEVERADGSWRDFALWQLAFARLTIGDPSGADTALADAATAADPSGDLAIRYCVLGTPRTVAAEQRRLGCAAALTEAKQSSRPPRSIGYYPAPSRPSASS